MGFAEVARRESTCSSKAQGGDLGLFGPGKMVPEFDAALFPEADPPPAGSMLGPIVTEFGCHAILVTKREINRDQIEEKLARNDCRVGGDVRLYNCSLYLEHGVRVL